MHPGHDLTLPKLYTYENTPADKTPIGLKVFNPTGSWTGYFTEYDPDEDTLFGFVDIGDPQNAELGYTSAAELREIRTRLGLKMERDLHFGQHFLKEVIDGGRP